MARAADMRTTTPYPSELQMKQWLSAASSDSRALSASEKKVELSAPSDFPASCEPWRPGHPARRTARPLADSPDGKQFYNLGPLSRAPEWATRPRHAVFTQRGHEAAACPIQLLVGDSLWVGAAARCFHR